MLQNLEQNWRRTRIGRVFTLNRVLDFPARAYPLPNQHKLGTDYGGWTVPVDYLNEDSICYCFGCGEDVSFDATLINQFQCNVHSFDPTPRAVTHVKNLKRNARQQQPVYANNDPACPYSIDPTYVDNLHFHPIGVWQENTTMRFYAPSQDEYVSHSIKNLHGSDDYFDAECHTIPHIMNTLAHDALTLIKLDIEGAEYEVINSMLANNILPDVLLVEFDEGNVPGDSGFVERIRSIIDKLRDAGYTITSIDRWNFTFVRLG